MVCKLGLRLASSALLHLSFLSILLTYLPSPLDAGPLFLFGCKESRLLKPWRWDTEGIKRSCKLYQYLHLGFTAERGQTLMQTYFNFSWHIIVNSTRSANSINAPINPGSHFEIWFALRPVFPAWLVSELWRVSVLSSSHSTAAAVHVEKKLTLFLASGLRGRLKRSRRMNKYADVICIYTCFHQLAKVPSPPFTSPVQISWNRHGRLTSLPLYRHLLNAWRASLRHEVLHEAVTKHQ